MHVHPKRNPTKPLEDQRRERDRWRGGDHQVYVLGTQPSNPDQRRGEREAQIVGNPSKSTAVVAGEQWCTVHHHLVTYLALVGTGSIPGGYGTRRVVGETGQALDAARGGFERTGYRREGHAGSTLWVVPLGDEANPKH